jgi:hypothetical protein
MRPFSLTQPITDERLIALVDDSFYHEWNLRN